VSNFVFYTDKDSIFRLLTDLKKILFNPINLDFDCSIIH